MGQKGSRQEASQRQGPAAQHNQHLLPDPWSTEHVLDRFPQRHSCQHCYPDVVNAFNAKSAYPAAFLRNRDDAIAAANDGCTLYEWLLLFFFRSQAPHHHGFYLQRTSLEDPRDISSVQFQIGTPNYTWPCAEFHVFTEAENHAASDISTRPFSTNVDSSASYDVVKSWLADCCKNHKECQSPVQGYLPTRLIDVSKVNAKLVKIVSDHKDTPPSEAAYATLSYCWGRDQFIKTTKATLGQHQVSIMTSSLGQTIQDAIKVVHSLGLRFLWVDSLCIIQDDPHDMALEISRMSTYYENGQVSICASVAAGCNEGFLERRKYDPYCHGPFELPYPCSNHRSGSIKLAKFFHYSKTMDPVNARAWIMQESLLATRILSYNYQNVAWSCRRTQDSNGGPRKWYDFADRMLLATLQDETNLEVCIRRWNHLVESYTTRSLSDSKDRLPAISGIAQKHVKPLLSAYYQPNNPRYNNVKAECADYVAGLWYCKVSSLAVPVMFCLQLLWSTSYYTTGHEPGTIGQALLTSILKNTRGSTVSTSPTRITQPLASGTSHTYLAPSWSWASVEGPITYEFMYINFSKAPEFAVLACDTQLELSEAPYGNVTSGRLIVQGSLIPVLHSTLFSLHWKLVLRPDKKESAAMLAKIMEGEREGWILKVTDGSPETSYKPIDPNWTDIAPKGLLIVAEGEYYRRIGLCSIEMGAGNTFRWDAMKDLDSYSEEKRIIII